MSGIHNVYMIAISVGWLVGWLNFSFLRECVIRSFYSVHIRTQQYCQTKTNLFTKIALADGPGI